METLENIKTLVETLSVDTVKFYGGNKSAGTRARKSAQELKALLQDLRKEIFKSIRKLDDEIDEIENSKTLKKAKDILDGKKN